MRVNRKRKNKKRRINPTNFTDPIFWVRVDITPTEQAAMYVRAKTQKIAEKFAVKRAARQLKSTMTATATEAFPAPHVYVWNAEEKPKNAKRKSTKPRYA